MQRQSKNDKLKRFAAASALFAAIILTTQVASANAGTPMIWLTMGWLLIGNFFIGIFEGRLMEKLYKKGLLFKGIPDVTFTWPSAIMVVANYFSAFIGMFVCLYCTDKIIVFKNIQFDIFNFLPYLLAMYFILYVLTIFLEWPFCLLILRKNHNAMKIALKASFVVQTISCAILLLLLVLHSCFNINHTLFTSVHRIRKAPDDKRNTIVYFLSREKGREYVYKIRLDGKDKTRLAAVKPILEDKCKGIGENDYCLTPLSAEGFFKNASNSINKKSAYKYDINIVCGSGYKHDKIYIPVERNITGETGTFKNPYYLDIETSKYSVRTFGWAEFGIDVNSKNDSKSDLRIGFESPFFIEMMPRSPTILPDDRVLFQFGDAIVLLEIKKRNLYQITRGSSPVVIMENKPPKKK